MWSFPFHCAIGRFNRLEHTCDVPHLYVWHDLSIRLTWIIHMCDVTDAYVWRDSFRCVTWLVYICGTIHSHMCRVILAHMRDIIHSCVTRDSFMCVMWRIHAGDITFVYVTSLYVRRHAYVWRDACYQPSLLKLHHRPMTMSHSYMRHDSFKTWLNSRHDSFIPATWLIHTCDMTHSYMTHSRRDSFIQATWLIHAYDMIPSNVLHDSSLLMTWLIHVWRDSCMTRLVSLARRHRFCHI